MKLNLKDKPAEWRKSALLAILGLALISSLLRWRHILTSHAWFAVLATLALTAVVAIVQPRWFRAYHLLSMRVGFAISLVVGRVMLVFFFIFIITPLGFALRLTGKDPLQLKRPENVDTFWRDAKEPGPLDRMF